MLADAYIGGARESSADAPAPQAHRSAWTSGIAAVDAALKDLALAWPLHLIHIDDAFNAEAGPDEGHEINVVFDDVSGHDFEAEIDALTEHLQTLPGVLTTDRGDREYIVVELQPGVAAHDASDAVDAASTDFMRAALSRRYA